MEIKLTVNILIISVNISLKFTLAVVITILDLPSPLLVPALVTQMIIF